MVANQTAYQALFERQELTGNKTLDLSVVVPTRNEAGNVAVLLERIRNAFSGGTFAGSALEVIFVDDSTDNTPEVVEAAAQEFPDLHVRLIHRPAEQRTDGLGGAVVKGLAAALSPYACVMDADLQHPPEMVPLLLRAAREKQADLVVATRRGAGSELAGLNTLRNLYSKGLEFAARALFPRALSGVSDPLTGFFLVRLKALSLDNLHPNGFKILLEILVRNPKLRKAEIPFRFGMRLTGQSKAGVREAWKYLSLLWTLRFNGQFWRFAGFAFVGATGILVNSLALYVGTDRLHIYYLLSAALATVASTLWNFALTELWVYRAQSGGGWLRRLAMFFVVNVLALSLRTPMIYVLTAFAGVHYVVSNLISLALLTIARFQLADNIIWSSAMSKADNSKLQARSLDMKHRYNYNLHDIVTVASDGELPELEPFRVDKDLQRPSILVEIGKPRRPKKGENDPDYIHYSETFGSLGFEVGIRLGEQVQVVASPSLRLSPHVLYTNVVEPILRWHFVEQGYALVHGATLAFGDEAAIITARTDTGKTTTLLKILSHQRRDGDQAAFLSDDMTVVSPDGMAMTYPKPLTISYHTLRAVNSRTLEFWERLTLPFQSRIHSRTGRRFAFFISKTHLPAATINMLMQMVVPPPKYFVSRLVPKVKVAQQAKLKRMFIIERGEEGTMPIENREAVEVLLQNCEDAYGFPPYEALKEFLYIRHGVDLREKEQAVIRQALEGLPATVVRSNTYGWWSRIPTLVNNEQVSRDFSRAHEVEAAGPGVYSRRPEPVSISQ